jgi:chromosome segregation protein
VKIDFIEIAGFRGFRDLQRFNVPGGFLVITGRNGVGKSTVLDAVDFALTGTIGKYAVTEAKGGGLEDHIWWVGSGKAAAHYVRVGFVGNGGRQFTVTRSREKGADRTPEEIAVQLCRIHGGARPDIHTLVRTSLIRDELISSMSLDLPEQARATAVRGAIGAMGVPDYSKRTTALLSAAQQAFNEEQSRAKEIQAELGRALGAVTEARRDAERASDIAQAMKIVESIAPALPATPAERAKAVRALIAGRRIVFRAVEEARSRAVALLPSLTELSSGAFVTNLAEATRALVAAKASYAAAEERLARALELESTERQADRLSASLAALVDHGQTVGLKDGHCPLCGAVRTSKEFEAAIAAARGRLAERGQRLAEMARVVTTARAAVSDALESSRKAESHLAELEQRRATANAERDTILAVYCAHGLQTPADDPSAVEEWLLREQAEIAELERASLLLEASSAVDRIATLEARVAALRIENEQGAARVVNAEKALQIVRQIDQAAKSIGNEILTEQFDTVMPLLKELYRRLRPHAEWAEIKSDFGGRVRASLNFQVGDGHNPQFLFSSGQRRAAGLAFLLAVHLSRPWCLLESLLLDDPVQHIDDYRALNLVEVLSAIRRSGRQVLVTVEDPALADLLCRRLRSEERELGRRYDLRTSKSGTGEVAEELEITPMPRGVLRLSEAS